MSDTLFKRAVVRMMWAMLACLLALAKRHGAPWLEESIDQAVSDASADAERFMREGC